MAAEQMPIINGFFTVFFKQHSGRGEVNRPVVSKKKWFAQIIFQPLYGSGQAGGGDVAFQAGATKMESRGQMPK